MKPETKIISINAREVLDSRGNPTVEVEVSTPSAVGRASVPSGASTGTYEAVELRDGDKERFHGKGVTRAVSNVARIIGPGLKGFDCSDVRSIDRKMIRIDGTANKGKLGANAILGVSMAAARAFARSTDRTLLSVLRPAATYSLPVPMMNVINGGEHADNGLAIQEFVIEPVGARSCSEGIRMGSEVYHSLKKVLASKYGKGATNVGDEGGFAPPMTRTREALDALRRAARESGYGEEEVRFGIDAAASTFMNRRTRKYVVDGRSLSSSKLEDYYASLQNEFALLTLEDPFGEEEFDAFASITKRLGKETKIIGDDIYVTNLSRMRKGIAEESSNGILVKLNQIGTVSETEDAIRLGQRSGWVVAVSHRSGETEDPFIAHLATAFGSEFIKAGAPARGERVEKYNELLRIEEGLGSKARYAGVALR
ncbi:MAG: phosphopyruvate hydratase [Thaumarchaeota archaeon]|nr:phosphopyruvate hydratase [Nitrososphaerota archaeon]